MDQHVQVPRCEQCDTAEYLIIESYFPPQDGDPGHVSYTCSGCDGFAGHAVPDTWVPAGWNVEP